MTGGGGCFAANLDVEQTWARRAGLAPKPLSAPARERASRLGLLCAVLWPEADALWTLAPVDAACRRDARLPAPRLVSGPPPTDAVASWGDVSTWRIGHRRWAFEHWQAWDTVVPEAGFVSSLDAAQAAPAWNGAWVLKAPFAAAGRDRITGDGRTAVRVKQAGIERLLSTYGELLLEPWMDRLEDYGCVVHGDTVHVHRLEVDGRGRFEGIRTDVGEGLDAAALERLHALAGIVRRDLAQDGYAGPFGFDAYRYRDPDGGESLRALCEVNPRYTFGHVATALRPLAEDAWGPGVDYALRVGDRPETELEERALSLVGSPDGDRSHAWLTPCSE
ncbi:MAG: hypothetical protein QNJ98_09305 [Planctomycetota bacterium]|nr:hypothetical protein [Planctomycetota bacterium]